jgi:hypothetical protein
MVIGLIMELRGILAIGMKKKIASMLVIPKQSQE